MLPTTPPVTERGLKAPSNIEANTVGRFPIFNITTPIASAI